jgi:ABC-2 type transport system ATP-binding protein
LGHHTTQGGNHAAQRSRPSGQRPEETLRATVAIDGLDFTVRRGEIFGLLGPNGAGKSTTLECILGTRTPDAGTVCILGQAPHEERRRLFARVGVQFQDANYPAQNRVGELYRMFAVLHEDPLPADGLLARFGLAGLERQEVATLSGGQRQKLSLASRWSTARSWSSWTS